MAKSMAQEPDTDQLLAHASAGDRSARQRLLVDLGKCARDVKAKFVSAALCDGRKTQRRSGVLKLLKFANNFRRQQVPTSCQDLTAFYVGRAEAFKQLGEYLSKERAFLFRPLPKMEG